MTPPHFSKQTWLVRLVSDCTSNNRFLHHCWQLTSITPRWQWRDRMPVSVSPSWFVLYGLKHAEHKHWNCVIYLLIHYWTGCSGRCTGILNLRHGGNVFPWFWSRHCTYTHTHTHTDTHKNTTQRVTLLSCLYLDLETVRDVGIVHSYWRPRLPLHLDQVPLAMVSTLLKVNPTPGAPAPVRDCYSVSRCEFEPFHQSLNNNYNNGIDLVYG